MTTLVVTITALCQRIPCIPLNMIIIVNRPLEGLGTMTLMNANVSDAVMTQKLLAILLGILYAPTVLMVANLPSRANLQRMRFNLYVRRFSNLVCIFAVWLDHVCHYTSRHTCCSFVFRRYASVLLLLLLLLSRLMSVVHVGHSHAVPFFIYCLLPLSTPTFTSRLAFSCCLHFYHMVII